MTVDRGLQHERTQLAWRRTLLSFGVVGLVVVRGAFVESAVVAGVVALAAVVLAVLLVGTTGRRGHWVASSAREPAFTTLRDGSLPMLVAAVAGLLCLGVVLTAIG